MKFALFAMVVAVAASGFADQPPAKTDALVDWRDKDADVFVHTSRLPPSKKVRDSVAGFTEGQFEDGNVYPRSAEILTIKGLRGLCYRGDVLTKPKDKKFLAAILFGKDFSYLVIAFGREDIPISVLEDHSGVTGEPLPDTSYITDEFVAHLNSGMPEFQRLIMKLAEEKRRANQALVPTPASVTPAADAPVAPAAAAAHL